MTDSIPIWSFNCVTRSRTGIPCVIPVAVTITVGVTGSRMGDDRIMVIVTVIVTFTSRIGFHGDIGTVAMSVGCASNRPNNAGALMSVAMSVGCASNRPNNAGALMSAALMAAECH